MFLSISADANNGLRSPVELDAQLRKAGRCHVLVEGDAGNELPRPHYQQGDVIPPVAARGA
jgi:hypothetical protein